MLLLLILVELLLIILKHITVINKKLNGINGSLYLRSVNRST
jgi:hypothetical protein